MGIYSIHESNESLLSNMEPYEIYTENFYEAGLQIAYETAVNQHNLMKAIGIQELAALEETGEEIVYEAVNVKGIIDKMKAAIMKLWNKIKALVAKFAAKFQSFGGDDKKFINRYKKQILMGSAKGLEVKGYNFTTDALTVSDAVSKGLSTDAAKAAKAVMGGATDTKVNKDDFEDKMRGAILGKGSLDASEFSKELKAVYRSGEDSPQTLENINKGELVAFLSSGTDKSIKAIKADLTTQEKEYNNAIKKLNDLEKKLLKEKPADGSKYAAASEGLANISDANQVFTTGMSLIQLVHSARMKAFNDKRHQCKSICSKIIGRKEPKNESYGYEDYDNFDEGASFISGVELI